MDARRGISIRVLAAIATVVVYVLLGTSSSFAQEKVVVFAAASLKNALDAISKAWEATRAERRPSPTLRARPCQADPAWGAGGYLHLGRFHWMNTFPRRS